MNRAVAIDLTVEAYDDAGVPVLLLAGLPGQEEVPVYLADNGSWRTLWPVRGLPVRLPERPIAPGLPSLPTILRRALAADPEVSHG